VCVMLTVCLWLLCACCFLQSLLLLPQVLLTNTFTFMIFPQGSPCLNSCCPVTMTHIHAHAHPCEHSCSSSSSWLHTDSHDSSCLAGPGDGDCGFRALLVAILLQVCCYGPAMGASMAARMKVLFDALPEWTQTPAVIAGYATLKVTLLATCAPFGCESECLMTS